MTGTITVKEIMRQFKGRRGRKKMAKTYVSMAEELQEYKERETEQIKLLNAYQDATGLGPDEILEYRHGKRED